MARIQIQALESDNVRGHEEIKQTARALHALEAERDTIMASSEAAQNAMRDEVDSLKMELDTARIQLQQAHAESIASSTEKAKLVSRGKEEAHELRAQLSEISAAREQEKLQSYEMKRELEAIRLELREAEAALDSVSADLGEKYEEVEALQEEPIDPTLS